MCLTMLAQKWFSFSRPEKQLLLFSVELIVCPLLCRLVNENEVKQWKEQAEKMRKGVYDYKMLQV